jgi:2-keto-3-deoxy-L-rhamnonate aldolase RhmA
MNRRGSFRERLRGGTPLIGTFSKTPSYVLHEVLALSALDCICIDAEHAPFGRAELDLCVAALAAADMPSIVRVAQASDIDVLQALDLGATAVMVPHVSTASAAASVAAAAVYGGAGTRGYAGSTRAARYTHIKMGEHIARSNAECAVIAQIEDRVAVENIEAIAAVERIDCLFVGRADLTVSLGKTDPHAPEVVAAVETVCRAAKRVGKAVGMFCPPNDDLGRWRAAGATLFLLESDHTFLLEGARALANKLPR